MTGYLFIYTRLDNFDYRLLYAPNESILPYPTRGLFVDFAREVINTDNKGNGPILEPRWSVIKSGNLTLFGVGCLNKYLGDFEQQNDTRIIRGFFGIVVESPCELVIPRLCDISFYKHIFVQYVITLWNLQKKDEAKTNSIVAPVDLDEQTVRKGRRIILNNRDDQCHIHPSSDSVQDIFISCLSYDKVDFVCNLNNTNHVLLHSLYAFHNITLAGDNMESVFSLPNINRHAENISLPRRITGERYNYTDPNPDAAADASTLNNIVDKVIHKLKRCRHSPIDFLGAFASRCGYNIVPKDYYVKKSEDYLKRRPKDYYEDLEPTEHITEDNTQVEKDIIDYVQKREDRRSSLSSLREQYHSEPVGTSSVTSLEEINDSEIVDSVSLSSENGETINSESNLNELQ